jgi:hypothetical protein
MHEVSRGAAIGLLVLVTAACASSGKPGHAPAPTSASTPPSTATSRSTSAASRPTTPPTAKGTPTPTTMTTGIPAARTPSQACLQAMVALKSAGADTLPPSDPAVEKALSECDGVAEWRGGLDAVPAALGYASAAEIKDQVFVNDLQVVCAGNAATPTCQDASRQGLLR